MLVEKPLYDEAVSTMAELAGAIRVGDPLDPETQMGSLISTAHRDRVHGFVERAADAEVVAGGSVPDGAGAFYPPPSSRRPTTPRSRRKRSSARSSP